MQTQRNNNTCLGAYIYSAGPNTETSLSLEPTQEQLDRGFGEKM